MYEKCESCVARSGSSDSEVSRVALDAAGWPSGWLLRSIKISLPLTAGSAAKKNGNCCG